MERRGAIDDVKGSGVWRMWLGPLPRKKNHFFVSKMISLGAFCRRFQQEDNTDSHYSLGTPILRFSRETSTAYKD